MYISLTKLYPILTQNEREKLLLESLQSWVGTLQLRVESEDKKIHLRFYPQLL